MLKFLGNLFSTPYERQAESAGPADTRTKPPVPWISTDYWQHRAAPFRYDHESEEVQDPCGSSIGESMDKAGIEALTAAPQAQGACPGPWRCLEEVYAESVPEKVVSCTPRIDPSALPKIPSFNEGKLQALVEATPAVLAQWNPMYWPFSDGHLWVLIAVNPFKDELQAIEAVAGNLDRLAAPECAWGNLRFDSWAEQWRFELDRIRSGKRPHEGVHIWADPETGALVGDFSHM